MNTNKKEGTTGMSNGSQMRITQEEIELIQRTFKGNDRLLKLMRKMFLPEIDPNAPVGQVLDLWMTIKIDEMTPEEALINLKARNTLISHVDQVLMQLVLISMQDSKTQEEAIAKIKADSAK